MAVMDGHDLCRMRDDVATMMLAVTSMKEEAQTSGLDQDARDRLVGHFQHMLDDMGSSIVIIKGLVLKSMTGRSGLPA